MDKRGTVDVLRRGVVDRNVTIQLAYFRPAHGLTPELAERCDANVPGRSYLVQHSVDPGKSNSIAWLPH